MAQNDIDIEESKDEQPSIVSPLNIYKQASDLDELLRRSEASAGANT